MRGFSASLCTYFLKRIFFDGTFIDQYTITPMLFEGGIPGR